MSEQSELMVSIGLPVYNGEDFLRKAVDSILSQSFTNFELTISDNGSTDSTPEISREYAEADERVRYLRYRQNRGAAWNFNNAFSQARGKYFQWAAHDDLYDPRFLQFAVDVLEARPEVVLCFAGTDFIDEAGQTLRSYTFPVDINNASLAERFLVYAAGAHIVHEIFGLIRTEVLRDSPLIGSYAGSDKPLLGFLALRGEFYQIPETLFYHREHPGRSTKKMAGAANYTQWFDSSKSGKYSAPFLRKVFENSKNVFTSDLSISEKAICTWQICRALRWRRGDVWRDLSGVMRSLVLRK